MGTRANVTIDDGHNKLWFYRHSDGYPEGVEDTLKEFLRMVKEGEIRNNTCQSAGFLIVLGRDEYAPSRIKYKFNNWKVGAYEPTTCKHDDIEFIYEIDLVKMEIRVFKVCMTEDDEIGHKLIEVWT
jgi:hypothetical protein